MSNPLYALFGPSCERVGQVLGGMVGCALGDWNKYAHYQDVDNLIVKKNLEALDKEFEKKKEELAPPIPEVGIPVLERLRYVNNETLSKAFINLLVNASTISGARLAHPGFIRIIDALSPDEAKILQRLNQGPVYRLYLIKNSIGGIAEQMPGVLTGLEFELELTFPENMQLYFENLFSLGLYVRTNVPSRDSTVVDNLLNAYAQQIQDFLDLPTKVGVGAPSQESVSALKLSLTSFGEKFMEACLS